MRPRHWLILTRGRHALRGEQRCLDAVSVFARSDADQSGRSEGAGASRRPDQPALDQEFDLVKTAIVPDDALGAHTASLGLAHSRGSTLPAPFTNGMFVGQHGSWNREPRSGYRVIFVPFAGGNPSGAPIDVLTGFVRENGDAMGRPIGVAIDSQGALLVAEDVGNVIWRVTAAQPASR